VDREDTSRVLGRRRLLCNKDHLELFDADSNARLARARIAPGCVRAFAERAHNCMLTVGLAGGAAGERIALLLVADSVRSRDLIVLALRELGR